MNEQASKRGGRMKGVIITLSVVGGVAALGAAGAAIWNSRQMRRMRAMRRTGALMRRVGSILCRASRALEEE